jgi:hypothetical protein
VVAIAALAFPLGVLANHQFSDVPTGASYHDDVEALVAAGVTTGCGGGEYCPTDAVTRGQMAQFLNRLGNLDGNTAPSVDADELDGLDSSAFVQPLFAVVNDDASVARGTSDTSATADGTGAFIVHFNRNIRDCAYTGSIGLSGSVSTSNPGMIAVVGAAIDDHGVYVTTTDEAGNPANLGFHVVVTCAGPEAATLSLERGPTVSGTNDKNQR